MTGSTLATSMIGHLKLLLYAGAATKDADSVQRARIRVHVLPSIQDKGVSYDRVYATIKGCMPAGWEPTGEYAEALEELREIEALLRRKG